MNREDRNKAERSESEVKTPRTVKRRRVQSTTTSMNRQAAIHAALSAALGILLALTTLFFTGAAPLDPPATSDPHIDAILNRVTTATLMADLADLTGERVVTIAGSLYSIATRNTRRADAISMTTRYAYEQLAACGLDVAFHTYSSGAFDGPRRNIIAEKPGRVHPEEIYLLTAHIDSISNDPDNAPGADDNGSGSVAVMSAACLLAPEHFAHTLRFVLFTGEEQGLRGSRAYAADCAAAGETIAGVVNLDMIGFSTDEPVFNAYAWSADRPAAAGSRELADHFSQIVTAYGLDLIPERLDADSFPIKSSDHWSFLENDYPAFLVIQDYNGGDFNWRLHSVNDTIEFINPDYFAELTRASIAATAHLGQRLSAGVLSGTARAADGRPLSPVTITAKSDSYVGPFPLTVGATNAFTASLPVGTYTVTAQSTASRYLPLVTQVTIATDTLTSVHLVLPHATVIYIPHVARSSNSLP